MKSKMEAVVLEQKKHLARWLEEWRVYQVLRHSVDEEKPAAQSRLFVQKTEPWDAGVREPICAGQVRLMHPAAGADARARPVYIVVLKEEQDGGWLIAPFSRFSEPATPGEWLTGLSSVPLRVLCLWNARVVPPEWLKKSWKAATLSKQRLNRALCLYRCVSRGGQIPKVFLKRIGPPLLHPLDPRVQYEMEERDFLSESSGRDGVPAAEKKSEQFYDDAPAEKEYLKAAESRPSYGRRKRGKKA